jgi:hypothetical protein
MITHVELLILTTLTVFASFPTWLTMRQHEPVEIETSSDEEDVPPTFPGKLTGNVNLSK